jgi:predicted DNA-binding transcriptional regulator AlpA
MQTYPSFPKPHHFGPNTSRWDEYDLDCYDAAIAGREPPERSNPPTYLRDVDIAERYAVSRQTVWRWASRAGKEVAA